MSEVIRDDHVTSETWRAAVSDLTSPTVWEGHVLLTGLAASLIVVGLSAAVVDGVLERRRRERWSRWCRAVTPVVQPVVGVPSGRVSLHSRMMLRSAINQASSTFVNVSR